MFSEYDPTVERETLCNFLFVHIGEGSLEEIKLHLENCVDCRFEVERDYYYYKDSSNQDFFPGVPEGLSVEEFLATRHLVMMREKEIFEHFNQRLQIGVEANFSDLLRLVRVLHRVVRLVAIGAPQVLLDSHYNLLESCYRSLFIKLGERETYMLLGFKDDTRDKASQFDEMLSHWRKVLAVRPSEEGR